MIHIVTPFRNDLNLGRAYNDAFARIDDDDWLCIMDVDAMFLTSTQPRLLQQYVDKYPNTGVFTCYTNRISPLAKEQLYGGRIDNDASMLFHIHLAERIEAEPISASLLHRGECSGFLMMISKRTWMETPAPEYLDKGGAIGVDTFWTRAIVASGKPIMRMNNLYIWHTYRLRQGIHNKQHLNA